jgi:predicted nucleic acid-binding protein
MKPAVVCNTGPLIALVIINRLELLKSLFQEVLIPEAIHWEILQGGASLTGVSAYRETSWIKVRSIMGAADRLLESILDAGEASVIRLAREAAVKLVLIDERKARKVARSVYGLQVIGTARVLVEAKREGLLENVGEAIEEMREAGYWIHDDIVRLALREAGEA